MGVPGGRRSGEVKVSPQFIEIIARLAAYFQNDYAKTSFWLTTRNLNFGGQEPLRLIHMGRGQKILDFIEDAAKAD